MHMARLSENSYSSATPPSKKRATRSSASSRRAKPKPKNIVHIKGIPKITAGMRREIEALKNLPDDRIDTSDIPEMTEADWAKPHWIGLHYRPGKTSVTIRLDKDMVAWFKK